jgi:hypothetical protein
MELRKQEGPSAHRFDQAEAQPRCNLQEPHSAALQYMQPALSHAPARSGALDF